MDVVVPPKFLLDTGILSWTDRKGSAGGPTGRHWPGIKFVSFTCPFTERQRVIYFRRLMESLGRRLLMEF